VKVNSLRADSNSPSNSINENKLKKISDDVKEANERVTENEQLLEKIADEIKVLRAEINTLDGKIK
jgi:F0F1-type ATP synthase membrane subunit b/b'